MTRKWVLVHEIGSTPWFLNPFGLLTKELHGADKFDTEKEAEKHRDMKERPWKLHAEEYEFDFENEQSFWKEQI